MTGDVPWLSKEEHHSFDTVVSLARNLFTALSADLQQDSALSSADYAVLVNLTATAQGRLRPTELATAMQWDSSRLSHQLRRMESRGLIDRERCPDDRRGAVVVITPAGRDAIEQAAPGHVRAVRRLVIDPLTPAELQQLTTLAEKLLAAMGPDGAQPLQVD
jgi:DNA-binding MarR family transcriptional regulator